MNDIDTYHSLSFSRPMDLDTTNNLLSTQKFTTFTHLFMSLNSPQNPGIKRGKIITMVLIFQGKNLRFGEWLPQAHGIWSGAGSRTGTLLPVLCNALCSCHSLVFFLQVQLCVIATYSLTQFKHMVQIVYSLMWLCAQILASMALHLCCDPVST